MVRNAFILLFVINSLLLSSYIMNSNEKSINFKLVNMGVCLAVDRSKFSIILDTNGRFKDGDGFHISRYTSKEVTVFSKFRFWVYDGYLGKSYNLEIPLYFIIFAINFLFGLANLRGRLWGQSPQ